LVGVFGLCGFCCVLGFVLFGFGWFCDVLWVGGCGFVCFLVGLGVVGGVVCGLGLLFWLCGFCLWVCGCVWGVLVLWLVWWVFWCGCCVLWCVVVVVGGLWVVGVWLVGWWVVGVVGLLGVVGWCVGWLCVGGIVGCFVVGGWVLYCGVLFLVSWVCYVVSWWWWWVLVGELVLVVGYGWRWDIFGLGEFSELWIFLLR
jgi:hypothetical protein